MPDEYPIYQYIVIFCALVAAGFGAPIPEEIPVVTGGILVGDPDKYLRWWIMLPVCILGVVISDGLLYGIGRWWGPRLLQYHLVKQRLLPPAQLQKIEDNFHKYGVKILLFARMLPGIRAPVFITAGIMRVPLGRFLLADGLYAIPGVSLLFFLGYWFTNQFLEIVTKLESIRAPIVVVVITAILTYLLIQFFRRPVVTGEPAEVPLIGTQIAPEAEGHLKPPAAESAVSPVTDGQPGNHQPAEPTPETNPASGPNPVGQEGPLA